MSVVKALRAGAKNARRVKRKAKLKKIMKNAPKKKKGTMTKQAPKQPLRKKKRVKRLA